MQNRVRERLEESKEVTDFERVCSCIDLVCPTDVIIRGAPSDRHSERLKTRLVIQVN